MAKSKQVAKVETEDKNLPATVAYSNALPDYLTGNENSGLEQFNKDDYNIPQVKLMHPISPEVQTYQGKCIPGEYWHTGLMQNLGPKFTSVVCVARKRVVLWRPKTDNGGGILAISNDSLNWDRGANQEFTVNIKGKKTPVVWKTGDNVKASGLLNFGTMDPDNEESAPAAILYYEYIHFLPDFPGASPVVQRIHKTGVKTARDLNAYFLMKRQQRVPIYACAIDWFVDKKPGPEGDYFIPRFTPNGHIDKNMFDITKKMNEQYADLDLAIEQDSDNEVSDKAAPSY